MQNTTPHSHFTNAYTPKSATGQLMDSIPSTAAFDCTGQMSIATAPMPGATYTSERSETSAPATSNLACTDDSTAMHGAHALAAMSQTPVSAEAAAEFQMPDTSDAPEGGGQYQMQPPQQLVPPAAAPAAGPPQAPPADGANVSMNPHKPGFLGPPTATEEEESSNDARNGAMLGSIPGPFRTGRDDTTVPPPGGVHMGGSGGGGGGGNFTPHSDQEKFAHAHPHSMHSSQHGRIVADATSGSVNRALQKYACAALPHLPADPKNPLMYTQAVFNEQDEFVDNTGKYKLVMKGSYAAVEVALVPGEEVKAESGGMVSMSTNVHMEAKLEGSAAQALTRCCCSGESMFLTYYSLKPGETRGDLLLAPALPGEVMLLNVTAAQPWSLQKSAYMASDPTITVTSKAQNMSNACCSGEGLFVLKVGGYGRLCANSYGGIMRYVLRQGEERTIDNTYLVAWYEQMAMRIEAAGGTLGKSFLSGEGFVVTFTGPGIVYVQTRAGGMFHSQ